jgi:dipeptidase E
MKRMIIASTSTLHGGESLDYLSDQLTALYKNTEEILFIPYARPSGISHENYTARLANIFLKLNKKLIGIHQFEDPAKAVQQAQGVFVGGGNTFLLVSQLYKNNIMQLLREAVLEGTPYLGTSAGSNICGLTMQTTNDMPIVYPPSFKTLGLVPFNINPHYMDPDTSSGHMGETRETRIKEYHAFNSPPVIGLREGSWLEVEGNLIKLRGQLSARVFEQSKTAYELATNHQLDIN